VTEAQPSAPTRIRSAIVLIKNGKVALIERQRAGRTYYVFPGGGVDEGESIEEAAVREAWEELGINVELARLLATVRFGDEAQHYHLANIVGGSFGTGTGEELASPMSAERGSYVPVWIELADLHGLDVRPRGIIPLVLSAPAPAAPPPEIVER
jgi:8-oxo-dGTP pyrophosphatase MutT (NUDIX family)